jgi:uncharacterized phage protein (TIGR01671 family)
MREIKFRQWDSVHKRYQFDIGVTGPGSWCGPSYVTWEKYPLEQFTGLHDKNGKEIYEGDIVLMLYTDWPSKTGDDKRTLDEYLDSISHKGIVKYTNEYGWAGFCVEFESGENGCIGCGAHGRITVIGNIHEKGSK